MFDIVNSDTTQTHPCLDLVIGGEVWKKNRKKPELFFAQHCNLFTSQKSSFSENKINITISQMAQITADGSTRGGEKKTFG